MSKPTYHLRVRTYPQGPYARFVSVWLVRRDGAAESALLWGEVIPEALKEITEATGLECREEHSPLQARPITPPECVPVAQQGTLFEE